MIFEEMEECKKCSIIRDAYNLRDYLKVRENDNLPESLIDDLINLLKERAK
jgi:hypothetical protein